MIRGMARGAVSSPPLSGGLRGKTRGEDPLTPLVPLIRGKPLSGEAQGETLVRGVGGFRGLTVHRRFIGVPFGRRLLCHFGEILIGFAGDLPSPPCLRGGTKGGMKGHISLCYFEEILKPIEQVRLYRNTETDKNHKDDDDPN